MNRGKRKLIFLAFAGILIGAVILLLLLKLTWPSKKYTAIQSIIKDLPVYQEEIESWGYQVSVFDPVSSNMSKKDEFALVHYTDTVYHPVLILTNESGEHWYFYNGFDQYAQEATMIDLAPIIEGGEEILRIVLQLSLCKTHQNRPPLKENLAKPGTRAYYDVEVSLYDDRYSLERREHVSNPDGSVSYTVYCSNNFEECKLFGEIDPISANRASDRNIKKRFTSEQLLGFYRQGLVLQEQLIALPEHR